MVDDLAHACPVLAHSNTTPTHPISRVAVAIPKAFRPETRPMLLSIAVVFQCPETPHKSGSWPY